MSLAMWEFMQNIRSFRKVQKRLHLYLVVLLLFAIWLLVIVDGHFFETRYFIEVRNLDENESILHLQSFIGDNLSFSYLHSVYLEEVSEIYRIDEEGKMVLKEVVTKSEKAVQFYATDCSFLSRNYRVQGGVVHITGINIKVDRLLLCVSTSSNRTLTHRGFTVPLYKLVSNGALVEVIIRAQRSWM